MKNEIIIFSLNRCFPPFSIVVIVLNLPLSFSNAEYWVKKPIDIQIFYKISSFKTKCNKKIGFKFKVSYKGVNISFFKASCKGINVS